MAGLLGQPLEYYCVKYRLSGPQEAVILMLLAVHVHFVAMCTIQRIRDILYCVTVFIGALIIGAAALNKHTTNYHH